MEIILDARERTRFEAKIQDALRGATITDAAITVYEDGSIGVEWIECHLEDTRIIGVRPPECDGDPVTLNVYDNDEQREMTVQRDFFEEVA